MLAKLNDISTVKGGAPKTASAEQLLVPLRNKQMPPTRATSRLTVLASCCSSSVPVLLRGRSPSQMSHTAHPLRAVPEAERSRPRRKPRQVPMWPQLYRLPRNSTNADEGRSQRLTALRNGTIAMEAMEVLQLTRFENLKTQGQQLQDLETAPFEDGEQSDLHANTYAPFMVRRNGNGLAADERHHILSQL
ncbi:hypothetical protein M514_04206, partial [Trichuris suis]